MEGPARSPQGAVALLRALSVDLLAVQARGPDGSVLAGDRAIPGAVVRERGGDGSELAAGLGAQALEPLVRHDLRAALDADGQGVRGRC